MRVWINALSIQGLMPRIEPVATVPVANLDVEEQRQIHSHAEEGNRLFNAPHYHQTLADLYPKASAARHSTVVPDQQLARWAFSRLARARARGSVPAWAAALTVTATAPLYLAALLLRRFLNTAVGGCTTLTAIAAWFLWDAGFDKAVREVLMPQLPVGEWSWFWSTYMAGPVTEIVASFSWTFLAMSLLLAGVSYAEVAEGAGVRRRR
jgi:hypothetical protein